VDISHLVGAQFDTLRASRDHSIWRWFDFFPLQHRSSIVSLGEGDTPLIRARRLGAYLDLSNLYLKKRHCFADRIA
jgi:threonine synthase